MRITDRRLRTAVAAVAVILPRGVRRAVHVHLLGHDIHPTARMGASFVDVDHLVMGPRALIGHLNVVRGLEELRMAEAAQIVMLVWVNAIRRDKIVLRGADRRPALVMGYSARILIMHFIDCCDLVELGEKASLAGYWSLVMTHTFDHRANTQSTRPIRLEDMVMVATRCTLLPGALVPARSIVAACSTVTGKLPSTGKLYAGTPAKPVRSLDESAPFFTQQPETFV